MRKTLLAIGFAVLLSMMVAPHTNKQRITGYGPFFAHSGFSLDNFTYIGLSTTDRVAIDALALQTIFLAVLLAMLVNIRWRRKFEANLIVTRQGYQIAFPREKGAKHGAKMLSPPLLLGHVRGQALLLPRICSASASISVLQNRNEYR